MSLIKLDLSKLLGFKILSKENINHQSLSVGAKVGEKVGYKTSPNAFLTKS